MLNWLWSLFSCLEPSTYFMQNERNRPEYFYFTSEGVLGPYSIRGAVILRNSVLAVLFPDQDRKSCSGSGSDPRSDATIATLQLIFVVFSSGSCNYSIAYSPSYVFKILMRFVPLFVVVVAFARSVSARCNSTDFDTGDYAMIRCRSSGSFVTDTCHRPLTS